MEGRSEGRLTAYIAGHAIQRKNPQDESQRFSKWRLPTLPRCNFRSPIGDAVSLPCALSLLPSPLSAPLSPASARSASLRSPAPARRRRAQPTPRMAHTAPHSATPPPMRHTRGGKRRLFLLGQKRYGLSQKRSIGLSLFRATAGRARVIRVRWLRG